MSKTSETKQRSIDVGIFIYLTTALLRWMVALGWFAGAAVACSLVLVRLFAASFYDMLIVGHLTQLWYVLPESPAKSPTKEQTWVRMDFMVLYGHRRLHGWVRLSCVTHATVAPSSGARAL